MNGADWFDFGMGELPRKVAKLVLVVLLLLPGGGFVTWYLHEKTAGMQEMVQDVMQDYLNGIAARLSPPTVLQPAPAVPQ